MPSRKDYRAIAGALSSAASVDDAARRIAAYFKSDNSRFQYELFYEACGLTVAGRVPGTCPSCGVRDQSRHLSGCYDATCSTTGKSLRTCEALYPKVQHSPNYWQKAA